MITAARLDLRLSTRDKDRIARAAELRGVAVSAFVRSAVMLEAEKVVAAEQVITMSPEESRRLIKALGKPFSPNPKLARALRRGDELGL